LERKRISLKKSYSSVILIIGTLIAVIFLMSAGKYEKKMLTSTREMSVEKLKPAPDGKRTSKKYSWELAYAKATETGDLEWTPKPFIFEAGKSIRYIDYEKGDDSNSGMFKSLPWKHHPWDANATGLAASCTGIQTYVFRRGSVYRRSMIVKESGEPGNPIHLTSDPAWGEGRRCAGEEIISQCANVPICILESSHVLMSFLLYMFDNS
jgi:hypothetical protein